VDEIDVSDEFAKFLQENGDYSNVYSQFFDIKKSTPGSQFLLIPYLSETFAQFLMNTLNFKQDWTQDFTRDESTERWDLINSDGVTIEVKSTVSEAEFRRTSVRTSIISQRESLIMRVYMEKEGINRMKFVRFLINQGDVGKPIEECKGKWINVTEEILN
jgi:hypothetical protein